MKKLRKGQQIRFEVIDDFTGKLIKRRGVVISDASKYIKKHPKLQAEYGGIISGEAYIVQESLPSKSLNLIALTDVIEILSSVPERV